MIEPSQKGEALLGDIAASPTARGRFHLWWLGQSGYLVQWDGHFLLLDRYLSDSLTRKYAATDKPHVRMTAQVVDPRRLGFVDWVTASHQHSDHLDPDTLTALRLANPDLRLICPAAHQAMARERSGLSDDHLVSIDVGGAVKAGPFLILAVPAAHETLEVDAAGRSLYLGFIVRFGPFTLYHSGDTVRYAGMEDWLTAARGATCLLPINGRAPERRVAGNLTGREAAQLAYDIGAGLAIPCHYEMFEFNTASPAEFVEECQRLGQRCRVLRAGERWTSPAIGS